MFTRSLMIALALSVLPAASTAQPAAVDPRWSAYLGCWQLQRESTGSPVADLIAAATRKPAAEGKREDVMICVTPAPEPNAVSQQTVLNGDTVLDEIVSADGTERSGSEASCRSTRRAEWSPSGRQLFSRGTVTCEGQPERRITGLSLVMPGPTWVDVQMVDVRDRRHVRVRRYGLSREQQRLAQAARPAAALLDRWTLDEVKSAVRLTEPEVLQAALIEVGAKLPLNARRLVELDEAGVPGPVVDVMLALTYPEKFVIERPAASSSTINVGTGGGGWGGWGAGGGLSGYYDPWLMSSQLGWLSLYSPFGYQYYGYYDPRFGPGWGWYNVSPSVPGTGSTGAPAEESMGRVVNGQGYTRVRPREPEPRPAGFVDRSGSDSGDNGGGSGRVNGGGAGVTSGGYTSGGGGSSSGGSDSGGRTAVPRPPGGVQ